VNTKKNYSDQFFQQIEIFLNVFNLECIGKFIYMDLYHVQDGCCRGKAYNGRGW